MPDVPGTPYRRVKQKATHMMESLTQRPGYEGPMLAYQVIAELIETAPEQTLDALCKVMDPDA